MGEGGQGSGHSGGLSTGAGAATPSAPYCAGPDPHPRKPAFEMPRGATDCHAHVFGPVERYPYAEARIYTPPDAPLTAYRRMLDVLGVERAVIVQPSVYGTDNSATLDALRAGGDTLRAVAVVEDDVADTELEAMHALGVRGIRFNVVDVATDRGVLPMDAIRRMARRVAPLGWHVQFLLHVDEYPDLDRKFADFPTEIVIDHFGYMKASKKVEEPGFQAFLRLMRTGRCWAKFTGAYRISQQPMPYRDVVPFAHALLEANADRVVWGTDWPHPKHEGVMPNDGELCSELTAWIPDAQMRERVLVANPARLYGFP